MNLRKRMAEHWLARHTGIRARDYAPLPEVSSAVAPCFEAGFCLCDSALARFVPQVENLDFAACGPQREQLRVVSASSVHVTHSLSEIFRVSATL